MQCGPNANEEGEMKPYATEEREVLHKSGETKLDPTSTWESVITIRNNYYKLD